jgi:hypothetical protein
MLDVPISKRRDTLQLTARDHPGTHTTPHHHHHHSDDTPSRSQPVVSVTQGRVIQAERSTKKVIKIE